VTKGKNLKFKELRQKEERKRDSLGLGRTKKWWLGGERVLT
jgi:hypothetical protein